MKWLIYGEMRKFKNTSVFKGRCRPEGTAAISSPCPLDFKDVPEHVTTPNLCPTKCHACKNDSHRPDFTSHSISLLTRSFFLFSSWHSLKRHHWICEKHDAVKRPVTDSSPRREFIPHEPASVPRALALPSCIWKTRHASTGKGIENHSQMLKWTTSQQLCSSFRQNDRYLA